MVFVEQRFLLFFVIVLAIHWSLRHPLARKVFLLAASYIFYACWDWRFLGLIWLSTLVDYGVARRLSATVDPARRRRWLFVSLSCNLGLLATFKYLDFFIASAVTLSQAIGLPAGTHTFDLILPVGISFYTFQTLSYTIDVYRGSLKARRSLLDVALFVGFFPQLVAGPIVRAADFLPQLEVQRRWENVRVRLLLLLFLVGYFKKAVVSDGIAPEIDRYFVNPTAYDVTSAWLALLLYGIQIYCDFSGYSDIAIACAGLLGYRLARNFDFPFFAPNISGFWNRWHISLSAWLRDYLYIPLGGNRGGPLLHSRNLLLTMVLGGLWHGAGARYLFWGLLHGVALVAYQLWDRRVGALVPSSLRWPAALLATLVTHAWITFAWAFFRSPDWQTATTIVRTCLNLSAPGSTPLGDRLLWLWLLLGLAHLVAWRTQASRWFERLPWWLFAPMIGSAFALILALTDPGARPFIYFQF